MNREQKAETVEKLSSRFERALMTVLADYRGLNVAEITELRRHVREAAGEFLVTKNTLAKIAVCDTNAAALGPLFSGPTAVAFGFTDPVAVAKAVHGFAEEHEALAIKGALFEGQAIPAEQVARLAALPSRDELRAQLLALMSAPAAHLLRLLSAPSRQLVQVLDARRRQQE